MKKLFFALSIAAVTAFASCSPKGANTPLKTAKDSLSYAIGFNFGQMALQIPTEDIDLDIVSGVIKSIVAGDSSKLTDTQLQEIFVNYFNVILPAKQQEASRGDFEKVLKENPKAVKDEQVGIIYEIIAEGDLTLRPEVADTALLHYTGTLFDGTVFDSSVERGEPVNFAPVGNTIPGFSAGVNKIGPGGKIKVWIPSALAYGPSGRGQIPANANLIFEIEVLEVTKAATEE
ncbi:MAG: FKBP-type peptidyl-prolyl cis-trans isomerase [Rikenellaceae bacterium]